MPDPNNLKFLITDVIVTSYRANMPPAQYNHKSIALNFNTKCTTAIAHDYSEIRLGIAITVSPSESKNIELLSLETEMVCPVQNLEEWSIDGSIELPEPIWGALITMAVSTARGVLLAYSASSIYGRVILPVLKELLPKGKFDLKSASLNK
jgi:hypothetical protein